MKELNLLSKIQIAEFEELSLNNFTGQITCTVFISGCNLRCRFCHNRDLVLSTAPFLENNYVLEKLLNTKTKNIALTGGEPLFNNSLIDFLFFLKEKDFIIKLDTNGTLPNKLYSVIKERLVDYIALDIKGFDKTDVEYITRVKNCFEKSIESIKILKEHNINFELRHTFWKIPEKDSVLNFFYLSNIDKNDKLFIQKFSSIRGILDKSFNTSVSLNETLFFANFLKDFCSIYLRGFQ